jgi:hypothetical protein
MDKAHLYELASNQGIPIFVVGGVECNLYFRYEDFGFCVSEILGQGCQVQCPKTLENYHKDPTETIPLVLIPPAPPEKVIP